MSTHRIIQRSLLTAFVLSLAGVAFARQPPALTKAQKSVEQAIACDGANARPGAGYRAAFERSGSQLQASPTIAKTSPGYRGIERFKTGPATSEVACTRPAQRPHRA